MSDIIYSYLQMYMDNRTKNLESDHLCIYYYHMDEMLGLESDVTYILLPLYMEYRKQSLGSDHLFI